MMRFVSAQVHADRTPARAHGGAFKYLSFGHSHEGRVRTLNEDAFLNRPEVGLWAVADGMGGHEGGDIASALVMKKLSEVRAFASAYGFRHAVSTALVDANGMLQRRAAKRPGGPIGATVVALLAHDSYFAALWAGDSRIYLHRNGALRQITRDHSVVQNLVDVGVLSEREAKRHPQANIVTRAVGAAPDLELDSVHGRIEAGDRFLLCSDGLTCVLSDREICSMLTTGPIEAMARRLIDRALGRGAPDNVTALLVAAESC